LYMARERVEDYRSRLLSLVQDQIRHVLDLLRKTLLMLEAANREEDLKKLEEIYSQVLKTDEAGKEARRLVEKEVSEIGAILTNREDFIRLVNSIDKIADTAEGVAFRILGLAKARMKINKDILNSMLKLGEVVLQTVTKLREALLAVTLNSDTFMQKTKETEDSERQVDELYRNLDLVILQSDMKVGQLLLVREIVSMLEDIADRAEESAETLRVLSFVIL
jgi:predicted phosphate transport protein (TIGR00153 family)